MNHKTKCYILSCVFILGIVSLMCFNPFILLFIVLTVTVSLLGFGLIYSIANVISLMTIGKDLSE